MTKSMPGDIGIVGFDNIPEAGWPSHALTTLRQPVGGLVEAVLATDGEATTGPVHFVPVELIPRGPTGARQ